MGLMNLFGGGSLTEKKIDKIAKLACNPFAQPDVRTKEMGRLLEDGSPAALRGVLKRFTTLASGGIADEDEKKWLEGQLVDKGADVIEPVLDYIRSEEKLTYPLRVYRSVAGTDKSVEICIEVLNRYGPDDHRRGEAKLQLIWHLQDMLEDERVVPALIPFLLDHSDDVRWAVVDVLEAARQNDALPEASQESYREALGQLVCSDETSPRIAKRVLGVLQQTSWQVPEACGDLPEWLSDEFFIDKKRFLRERVRK